MQGRSHRLIGGAFGVFAVNLSGYTNPIILAMACVIGSIGGTAPDWLELPYANGRRVIKHRTITHWLPLWLLALGFILSAQPGGPVGMLVGLAFVSGALSHLLMDWPNPAGIPLLWPTKRHSWNLWRSGDKELWLVLGCWVITVAYYVH